MISAILNIGRDIERPFAYHEGQLLRVADLLNAAGGMLGKLREADARCAIYCESSANFTALLLALMVSGRQAVILPNNHPAFLNAIAGSYDALLGDSDVQWTPLSVANDVAARLATMDVETVDLVFFTSGSTGQPKPVYKNLRYLLEEVATLEALWGETVGDATVIGSVSQQHLYGFLFRSLWPLCAGRVAVSEQLRLPEEIVSCIKQVGNVVLVSSPALLKRLPDLMDLAPYKNSVRAVFSSGGPLPSQSAATLNNMLQQPVREVLGSTETGGIAWRCQHDALQTAWTLFPGMRIEECNGVLQLRSPFLAEVTDLDDAGFIDAAGRLHLQRRRDNVVKIEEKRVSLSEIENQIMATAWVEQVRVVLQKNAARESSAAVVVLNAAGERLLQEQGRRALCLQLEITLAQYFDRIVMPKKWRFIAAMPQNDMGKTTEALLLALFAKVSDSDAAEEKPVLPELIAQSVDGNLAQLSLRIPENLLYFEGHFPEQPIVPGVVQLQWAEHFMRCCFADIFDGLGETSFYIKDMEVIKFQQLMLPGHLVKLALKLDREKQKLHFEYSAEDKVFSSGRLVLSVAV